MPATDRPTALISYSHDSPEHEQRVLALCNRLRERGIDTMVDQFLPGAPSEGWPLWMEREIERRDFTLMICTEAYQRRFMEDEEAGVGRGVVWEARILRNLLYEDSERAGRIVPVLLEAAARAHVPTVFRGHFYDVSDERGFESLLRHLLQEPGAEAAALGALGPQGSRWSAFERPWVVPDAMRTRFFTGRENLLARLRQQLVERGRAALSGLGGIGKTQSALAYATRHRADYPDGVFWVNAETAAGATTSFVEIAGVLGLAAAASTHIELVVRSVLDWFNGTGRWLQILDNVEDRREIEPFLPRRGEGHVLLTSRGSAFGEIGIARALSVTDLEEDESVEFLLRRTGREGDAGELAAARELAEELGHLPLALAQAAAYVAETDASFADYLKAFRKRRVTLLERAGGLVPHEGVTVTWAANFEAVERDSPAAADVLRLSAFLAPDAIPFELLYKGAQHLGEHIAAALPEADDPLAMNELLRPVARYSLVRTDAAAHTFGMHRLVQEIERGAIAGDESRKWIEGAAGALNAAFPEAAFANWAACDRLVPHVVAISDWIASLELEVAEAAPLLMRSGVYLRGRGRYAEAARLSERGVAIYERTAAQEDLEVALALTNLAMVYLKTGQLQEAATLHERALAIREPALGPDHPDVAFSIANLAAVLRYQGRFREAEPLSLHALAIRERTLPPDHPDVASSLVNVSAVYGELGRYAEGQPMLERALGIWERILDPDDPRIAGTVNNLGVFNAYRGRYAEAIVLHERALAMQERVLGPDHSDVAISLDCLSDLYSRQGRYAEAEAMSERAVALSARAFGEDHPDVAFGLTILAFGMMRARSQCRSKSRAGKSAGNLGTDDSRLRRFGAHDASARERLSARAKFRRSGAHLRALRCRHGGLRR